jgi:DNA gyrase subunit A
VAAMDIGDIELVDIDKEMREAYLDYAMSVITSRALPDVRDGLKPVQRRILYTMYDAGLRPDRAFKKSAATVGDVLGRYHPHGDQPVYDAMVRLAQGFSMRYPLVDGQGNFGSVDGDPPAAYRYTEARPTSLAMELLADIDKETVEFRPNFDDSRQEPMVMPARVPNLLVNGASGIAVGMATNIPPHNLGEVCDALVYLIDHHATIDDVSLDEILPLLPGPDFPTGASIVGLEGIKNAYATGRGRVIMRAITHIEELKDDRVAIIVDEIPYQVNKATLVERIADLARSKRVDTISDLRDETDRTGMRVVIELKRGADPHVTLNRLMKYSTLQQTFGVNILALVEGEPRVLPLKQLLAHYLEHREDVIRRRSAYELARARARLHVLDGLRIALANLDAVIETIRHSTDAQAARDNLMSGFGLSEIQAQAILDMQLRRLAALEQQRIEDEHRTVTAEITALEALLADEAKILAVIRTDLLELKAGYGDPRRTVILAAESDEMGMAELVAEQDVLVTVSDRGYIKRVPADTYRAQGRGGRGIRGATTREDDAVRDTLLASTHDKLLFFSDRGRVYELPAYAVPATSRESGGTPLINLIQLEAGERVTVNLAVPAWQFEPGSYLVMCTRRGKIKRTVLSAYEGVRPSGLIGINLEPGDTLRWAQITTGDDEIVVVTRRGRALRFSERQVRPMGRAAAGVMAIRLREGDEVAAMDIVRPDADLLVVTTLGYGKRSPLASYPRKRRHGQGVLTIDTRRLAEVGEISDARVVEDGDEVALISDRGIVMRTTTDAISRMGRATRGVRVMRLDEGHQVASMAIISGGGDGSGDAEGDGPVEGESDVEALDGDVLDGDALAELEAEDDLDEETDAEDDVDDPTDAEGH